MTELWKLRKFNLFAGLNPAEKEEILDMVTIKGFARGEFLFQPGAGHRRIYLLQHGRVKVYLLSPKGNEKIVDVFLLGDVFGSFLLDAQTEALPWAEALDDVVAGVMDEAGFRRFMQTCSPLCLNLMRHMRAQNTALMQRLGVLLHSQASHRLVQVLLDLGDRLEQSEAEHLALDPSLTHEELANLIGVARTTVSELIGQLREVGILGGSGRRLVVYRRAAEQFLQED